MHELLETRRAGLIELCRKHRVRRLALFGSATRSDFDPEKSDIDLLVEFEDTKSPGYADRFMDFAQAAEALMGRPVDLVTPRSLSNPIFSRTVELNRQELYAA